MLKTLLAGAAAAALLSTSVLAADLPARRMAPPPPPPPPVFTWTGFYIGGNAGYAFDYRTDIRTSNGAGANAVPLFRPAAANFNASGFTGGLQIGANYELGDVLHLSTGGLVFGVEADAEYTDLKSQADIVLGGRDNSLRSRLEFLGTARGRLGYAFDRALIYGTGGFAYGDERNRADFYTPGLGLVYSGSRSKFATGYVYGGGIEYALPTTSFLNVLQSSAVTARIEFLHYDLGTQTLLVPTTARPGGPFGSYTQRIRSDGNLVRAALNFKFGAAPIAPVVARY